MSLAGLAMTLAYLLAAFLCWRAAAAAVAPDGASGRYRRLARSRYVTWTILSALLVLLAIDRQLNLLALLTDSLLVTALQHGWYHERRDLQQPAAIALTALGAATLVPALFLARRAGWWAMLGVAGLVALLTFALIRAISWHLVDEKLWSLWLGMSLNQMIEAGMILLVLVAAWFGRAGTLAEMRLARLRALAFVQRRQRERGEPEREGAGSPS